MIDHIHKYMRVILGGRKIIREPDGTKRIVKEGGTPVYKCMVPGCTHYVQYALALGRHSICWKCGAALILNPENLRLRKPTHRECRKTKEIAS